MSELIPTIFLFLAVIVLSGVTLLISGHLRQIFKEPAIQKRMRRLRKPVQPWVTVIVHSRNNENLVNTSLRSLRRSYYHNFDIVVVDDYSSDAVKALKKGYRKSRRGEIVISLQAGVIVPRSFVKRAVAMKAERPLFTIGVSEILSTGSLGEIIQTLNSLVWQCVYKVRVSDFKNISVPEKSIRLDFLTVFIFVAIVATSLTIYEPSIIWYSWLIVTGYLLAAIWLKDEKLVTKLQLTFASFPALFLLPAAGVVMSASQRRSRN